MHTNCLLLLLVCCSCFVNECVGCTFGNMHGLHSLLLLLLVCLISCVNGFAGSTFDSMHGLGGALRLFVAALWLESSVLQGNTAQAIAGAIFFNQSCLQVCFPCAALVLPVKSFKSNASSRLKEWSALHLCVCALLYRSTVCWGQMIWLRCVDQRVCG